MFNNLYSLLYQMCSDKMQDVSKIDPESTIETLNRLFQHYLKLHKDKELSLSEQFALFIFVVSPFPISLTVLDIAFDFLDYYGILEKFSFLICYTLIYLYSINTLIDESEKD